MGGLESRHRGLRHPLRDSRAERVPREPGCREEGPCQHLAARPQPHAVRDGRPGSKRPRDTGPRQGGRGCRDQPRRAVLHGKRVTDEKGDPQCRKPPEPGTRHHDGGARGDGGGLPVHLPLPSPHGELLSHLHHLHEPEVTGPRFLLHRVHSRGCLRHGKDNREDGSRELSEPEP